jgi:hypothetical protein
MDSAQRTDVAEQALRTAMPYATVVEGNRFDGVAAALAYAGATLPS